MKQDDLKLVVMKYGESFFGENNIFKGGREDVLLPISFVFYLIQTQNRLILVDIGCDNIDGFVMKHFCKPVEFLKRYGLDPENITDVIITHSHHDHIDGVRYYKNAVIYIQKDELEDGRSYIPDKFSVHTFDDEYALLDRIHIKKISGHSKGSCIVTFKHDSKEYVLCGDECYVDECFRKNIPTGISFSAEKSEGFVRKYGDKKYNTILFHDPGIMPGRNGYEVIL